METFDYNRETIGLCDSLIKEAEAVKDYTYRLQETQSDAMKAVYTDNRMDELPHIQNLAIALTSLLNGEEPMAAAKMEDEERADGFGGNRGDKRLTIKCNDKDDALLRLIEYLKENSDSGHSFSIVVDPGDPEREKTFGIDGDGSDRIHEVRSENVKAGGEEDE